MPSLTSTPSGGAYAHVVFEHGEERVPTAHIDADVYMVANPNLDEPAWGVVLDLACDEPATLQVYFASEDLQLDHSTPQHPRLLAMSLNFPEREVTGREDQIDGDLEVVVEDGRLTGQLNGSVRGELVSLLLDPTVYRFTLPELLFLELDPP